MGKERAAVLGVGQTKYDTTYPGSMAGMLREAATNALEAYRQAYADTHAGELPKERGPRTQQKPINTAATKLHDVVKFLKGAEKVIGMDVPETIKLLETIMRKMDKAAKAEAQS